MNEAAPHRPAGGALFGTLLLALLALVLWNGWLTDDGYITLRTVRNFLTGEGLRWNLDERVQTFTHPLWMFTLSGVIAVSGEYFFTVIVTSALLAVLAVALAVGVAVPAPRRALAVLMLLCSRAFTDYSTSGLENPLSFLLMAAFLCLALRPQPSLRGLSLVTALVALNRLDLLLVCVPVLGMQFLRQRSARAAIDVAVGFLPLLAWEAFSLVYYGALVPNTAYAKLNTGVSLGDYLAQARFYFADSLRSDPLTLTLLGAGIYRGLRGADRTARLLALGVALYLLYLWRIGGDYHSGRFFAAPLLVAVVLLARESRRLQGAPARVVAAALLLVALITPHSHLRAARDPEPPPLWHGVSDARMQSFAKNALRNNLDEARWQEQARATQMTNTGPLVTGIIGKMGFQVRPEVYVVDFMALADPLLAQLPCSSWKIGHFHRLLPNGYLATLRHGGNRIRHPELAAYYERIRLITRGEIWSGERFRVILDRLLGRDRHLVESYNQRAAPVMTLAEVRELVREDHWPMSLGEDGLRVRLDPDHTLATLEYSVRGADRVQLTFQGADGAEEVVVTDNPRRVLLHRVAVPPAPAGGWREVHLLPQDGSRLYYLQFLREGR